MNGKRYIAILITIILIGLIFYKINFAVLWVTLKTFNYNIIPKVILIYVLSLYVRGFRWKVLLPNNDKYSLQKLTEVFTAGSMLNVFVPARAGDIFRACYLGETTQEKKMTVLGTIVLERIFDGIAVFLILFAGMLIYYKNDLILRLTVISGILFFCAICSSYLILHVMEKKKNITLPKKLQNKLPEKFSNAIDAFLLKGSTHLNSFADGFKGLMNLKAVSLSLISSLAIWWLECIIAYLVLSAYNSDLGIASGMFVTSFTSLSTVIPSASVLLGPFQYAYILAAGLFGIGKSSALAVAAVHQSLITLVLTVLGLLSLIKFNVSPKKYNLK